jgi:hypothetical protein
MKDLTPEELVDIMILQNIHKCIKQYGLEGTLECILRVYPKNSEISRKILKVFYSKFQKLN